MRKFVPLIIFILLTFSCNKEKKLKQDLTGVWQVYKYSVHGFDETSQFDSVMVGYTITFTNNGYFTESYSLRDTVTQVSNQVVVAGTYAFKNDDQVLALYDSIPVMLDSVYVTTIGERDYTLFDLTAKDVELLTDTSEIYMSKK